MHSGSRVGYLCTAEVLTMCLSQTTGDVADVLRRIDDEADDLLNGTDGLSKGAASWTIPTSALKDTLGMRAMRSR
jgi:hypothetical protein